MLTPFSGAVHLGNRRKVRSSVAINTGQSTNLGRCLAVFFVTFVETWRLRGLLAHRIGDFQLLMDDLGVFSQRFEVRRFFLVEGRIGWRHVRSHDHVASDAGCWHTCH
ncbi:hypothetical protein [Mycobacterium sp. 663a-19]|uniref:hypothetical protein n=1 Tax=Mycobacterium sp. 663a-19 TaxID=2986148 RepID=UPI002D797A29|nr:hypothetical protein [Mycobacterium sp. 663a-19]